MLFCFYQIDSLYITQKIRINMILMEGAVQKQLLKHGILSLNCKQLSSFFNQTPFMRLRRGCTADARSSSVYLELSKVARHDMHSVQVQAFRKRRANMPTETYVLLEPGKNEEFVSEEELKARLKGWLENWPGNALPPDLTRFKSIDDTVSHLVKSVCELEIDGELGSIQWYEVRLE